MNKLKGNVRLKCRFNKIVVTLYCYYANARKGNRLCSGDENTINIFQYFR